MSTTNATGTTTVAGRLGALGRAELTLLVRSKATLFAALFVPVVSIVALRSSLDKADLDTTGMTVIELAMTGGIGVVLIMAVYSNLVAVYTARREGLVLKRLRTVETSDPEILAGTALPAVSLALAQCVVLVTAGAAFLDVRAPAQPLLLLGGVLAGLVLLTALAAATSAFTRTVDSAQITAMPLFLVSAVGSGLFVPLQVLPDGIAHVCELLPMTGAMTLIRAGWLGGASAGGSAGASLNALVWILVSVFAVRRWFRWEPRH